MLVHQPALFGIDLIDIYRWACCLQGYQGQYLDRQGCDGRDSAFGDAMMQLGTFFGYRLCNIDGELSCRRYYSMHTLVHFVVYVHPPMGDPHLSQSSIVYMCRQSG